MTLYLLVKPRHELVLVLVHSSFEVVGYTDIECPGAVGQEVDVVLAVLCCGQGL